MKGEDGGKIHTHTTTKLLMKQIIQILTQRKSQDNHLTWCGSTFFQMNAQKQYYFV